MLNFVLYFVHVFCGFSRFILLIRSSMCMAKEVSILFLKASITIRLKNNIPTVFFPTMTIELSLIRIKTCTSLLGFIVYLPRIKEYAVLLLIFFRLVLLLFQKSDIIGAHFIFLREVQYFQLLV